MTAQSGEPIALVSSNLKLFNSFFDAERLSRLSQLTRWERSPARTITPALRQSLQYGRSADYYMGQSGPVS